MGNKLMTKKQWKSKQFFFLLKTENKLKKNVYLNYVTVGNNTNTHTKCILYC